MDSDTITEKYHAKHGRIYYKNERTGKTAWSRADVVESAGTAAEASAPRAAAVAGGGGDNGDGSAAAGGARGGGDGDHIVQFFSKVGRLGFKNTKTGKCGWSREEVDTEAAAAKAAKEPRDTGECFMDGYLEKYHHDVVLDSLYEFEQDKAQGPMKGTSDTKTMVDLTRFKTLMVQGIEVWRRVGRKTEKRVLHLDAKCEVLYCVKKKKVGDGRIVNTGD